MEVKEGSSVYRWWKGRAVVEVNRLSCCSEGRIVKCTTDIK